MTIHQIFQIIAVLLTGLVAGLFYFVACSLTGGLGKLPDKAYLMAFQSINRVILNPWFFAGFMGCLLVLPVASWLSYNNAGNNISFYLMLSANIVYVVGVFGVTVVGNVPLNNMLEHFNITTASAQDLFSLREKFEAPWNKFNLIRTIAAVLSFLLAILSILKVK